MATINREKMLSKSKLLTVFKIFDKVLFFFSLKIINSKDGSGTISISELKEHMGTRIDDEVWKELIGEVCKDGE